MNIVLKKSISVSAAILLCFVWYYGTYQPFYKSELFISAMNSLSSVRVWADFTKIVSVPLDAPSPIGREELVRNTGSTILGIVNSTNSPDVVAAAVQYLANYFQPIIERGRGMSFDQNLFIIAAVNEAAFVKTHNAKYLQTAKQYYLKGLEFSPERPQFLYGMFDVYRGEGDVQKAVRLGQEILNIWPDDRQIRNGLIQFLNQVSTSSAQSKKAVK